VLDFAARVLSGRPGLLQLRAKGLGAREMLELAKGLASLCRKAGTAFFLNDRPDLAVLAGADGVHVGQSDLAISDVRRFAPALRIGTSTHDFGELDAALAERPEYVAFGPVFPTDSKSNPEPVVGIEALAEAARRARAAGVPLVAIGGIDRERMPLVARLGVSAAVIGALVPEDGDPARVADRARELADVFEAAAGPSPNPRDHE
jgi:thiamine-phosphate pyrophosphorylase